MALSFMTGFEAQQVNTDNITLTGTASISTAQHRTGAASLRCNPASGASGYMTAGTATISGIGHSFGMYVATLPSVDRIVWGNSGVTGNLNLRLTSTGTVTYYQDTTLIGTSSAAFATPGWHWVSIHAGSISSATAVQIDGANEITGSTSGATTNVGSLGCRGTEASAIDVYFDDFLSETASWSGFFGPSNVDIALPISDNTVTGVTDNNGATTNIWQCVDNIPPAGVASANEAANPKAGMHFTASATDNYIANLETYTTLGVGASDTVLAVQALARCGEDIATGTKTMQNVGALTNPVVAGASITVGGDAGAHGAETGLWVTTFGTLTTSPSVTLGTSPTIRASRVSEARLACVDFMGMLVAWTPAVVAVTDRPYVNIYPQLLAQ